MHHGPREGDVRYLLALLVACSAPTPTTYPDYPPIAPDAGASCERACTHLRELGCPEGSPDCTRGCQTAAVLRPLPLECWANATDSVNARACGGLRCK